MVHWHFQDDEGKPLIIKVIAKYIPSADINLFSPQDYFQHKRQGALTMDHRGVCFYPDNNPKNKLTI